MIPTPIIERKLELPNSTYDEMSEKRRFFTFSKKQHFGNKVVVNGT